MNLFHFMKASLFSITLLVALTSCSDRPEELIQGVWRFDHATSDAYTDEQLIEVNTTYSDMRYEFNDGTYTCDPGKGTEPTDGRYGFIEKDRVVLHTATVSDTVEILKLDKHNFIMYSAGVEIVLIR